MGSGFPCGHAGSPMLVLGLSGRKLSFPGIPACRATETSAQGPSHGGSSLGVEAPTWWPRALSRGRDPDAAPDVSLWFGWRVLSCPSHFELRFCYLWAGVLAATVRQDSHEQPFSLLLNFCPSSWTRCSWVCAGLGNRASLLGSRDSATRFLLGMECLHCFLIAHGRWQTESIG